MSFVRNSYNTRLTSVQPSILVANRKLPHAKGQGISHELPSIIKVQIEQSTREYSWAVILETQAQRTLLIDPTERDSNLRYLQNSKPSITLLGNF